MPLSPATPSDSNIAHVLPALHHALSGSTGTVIATCTLYPLSLVIARLQVQRQLHRQQGAPDPAAHHLPVPRAASPRSSAASPSPPVAPKSPPRATPTQVSRADAQHQDHHQLQPQESRPPNRSQTRENQRPEANDAVRSITETAATEKEEETYQEGSPRGTSGSPQRQTAASEKKGESYQEGIPLEHVDPIPLDASGSPQRQIPATNKQSSSQFPASSSKKTSAAERAKSSSATTPRTSAQNAATEAGYAGILDAFSRIYGEEGGLRALYSGLSQDAAKSFLDSFLFFMFYEWFRGAATSRRRRISRNSKQGLGVFEDLAVGMAAGAVSRAFTTPIANVVTRKQTASLIEGSDDGSGGVPASEKSLAQIMRDIRAEKGLSGLWGGYSATLLLTLNPALTFFLQDFLKKTLLGPDRWDDPGPQLTFLIAASSKAAASAITYPFQIAKTRLQAGVPIETPDEDEDKDEDEEDDEERGRSREPRNNITTTAHVNPDGSTPLSPSQSHSASAKVDSKLHALSTVRNLARRSIFGTIAAIVHTEGVGALYDGILGELLKGFFSHGTTMLAKDVVHKLVFKLYLFTAGLLAEWKAREGKGHGHGGPNGGGSNGGGSNGGGVLVSIQHVLDRLRNRLATVQPFGISSKFSREPLPSGATVRLMQNGDPTSPTAHVDFTTPIAGIVRTTVVRRKHPDNHDGNFMVNLVGGTHRIFDDD